MCFDGRNRSMGSGCGPANADKALGLLRKAEIKEIRPYIADVSHEANGALDADC